MGTDTDKSNVAAESNVAASHRSRWNPTSWLTAAFKWYHRWPLYLRILFAIALGVVVGLLAGESAADLELVSSVVLRLLGAIAPILILVAVAHTLMTAQIPPGAAGRLARLLLINTTVAILIGLLVSNILRPGTWTESTLVSSARTADATERKGLANIAIMLLDSVPRSFFGPLTDRSNIIGVIMIAIAVGVAARSVQRNRTAEQARVVNDMLQTAFDILLKILHWIIDLVPIGVFCIIAAIVGEKGFEPFKAMGAFIITVLCGLALQATWYLTRIRLMSWVRPTLVLRGMRDAFLMAFSTDSSTVTMPVTYDCLRRKVGVREESASLGAFVGANFNNDGTALYEAAAALFVAQLVGVELSIGEQLIVVLTSILASVGAAGIPEAGLVTLTLVLQSVRLPVEAIGLLMTVDWFLDRCRTVINVMGDVNVACLLDGKTRQSREATLLLPEESEKIPPDRPPEVTMGGPGSD